MKIIIVISVTILLQFFPNYISAQNVNVSFIGAGEYSWHRLKTPSQVGSLTFSGRSFSGTIVREFPEPQQNIFPGIRVEVQLKNRFYLHTQFDYGYDSYGMELIDAEDENILFSPLARGIQYSAKRLNFSLLPTYEIQINKLFFSLQTGITRSIEVDPSEPFIIEPRRPAQLRTNTIANALNRAYGGDVWKVNGGINIGYGAFFLHANLRYQIESASEEMVTVEGFLDDPIPFDNRLTAFQFGLGYRIKLGKRE